MPPREIIDEYSYKRSGRAGPDESITKLFLFPLPGKGPLSGAGFSVPAGHLVPGGDGPDQDQSAEEQHPNEIERVVVNSETHPDDTDKPAEQGESTVKDSHRTVSVLSLIHI